MKLFFLLVGSFLVSTSLFAAPKVGDTTYMEGSISGGGASTKVTTMQTVISYAANTDVFTVRQLQTMGNESKSEEVNVSADDLLNEETAGQIVAYCESNGIGVKEKVVVKAGKFNACKVEGDAGSLLWIAAVPFGIVRFQIPVETGLMDLQLFSFAHGN